MSVITKDLGAATAYGYAVEKGYTGTEEEFAELMASYATVGQTAVDAKDAAVAANTAAQTAATTATTKASEATTAATTATTKAGEASTSASTATSAKDTAVSASQTATTKASEATTAAATATSAASTATTAKDDAVSAKTAAQTAQTGAETARDAVQSSATQIATNASDITALKEELSDLSDANVTWIDGMYIGAAWGTENAHASYKCTDFIPVSPIGKRISFGLSVFANVATYALYDKDKHFISSVHSDSNTIVWVEDTVEFNAKGVMYVRFTTQKRGDPYVKASSHFTDQLIAESIDSTLLADGSISSGKLQDKSVVVDKLSSDVLIHDENTNLIDYTKASTGKYIYKDGISHNSTNINATDFIPLTSGKTYYQNYVHNTYYAFYDGSYQFLTGYEQLGNLANSFTVPTGASFGRFTILDQYYGSEQAWISTKNAEPKPYKLRLNPDNIAEYAEVDPLLVRNPCDYTGRDVSAFTKCICIGDSLTAGTFNYRENGSTAHYVNYTKNSYPTYFQKLTGIETVNKGHGGSTTIGWWNTEQNTDLSGFDMAIIQLGANDLVTGQTEWPAESKTALSNIISKLITENNNIKVFVANIIPATSYPNRDHISTGIKNLVTELANPNVIFLDMAQYSHVGERTDYNCGHLSAYGYWRLAQDYANYIGHIMATDNADVFREIQFIGTNYQFHA